MEKLNSSQQDREGKTPYDLAILVKLAIHQARAKSRTREREREREIKHIATDTNPSPEGGLLPPHRGGRRDGEAAMIPPSGRVSERV